MKNLSIAKKIGIRFISVATMMTLVMGSIAGCGNKTDDAIVISLEQDEDSAALQNVMEQQAGISHSTGSEMSKEEVVYVLADANGNANDIIVSDWLKNTNGEAQIKDASNLKNIVNVSGDEDYLLDDAGNIVWNANGNDIHYQGSTDSEIPVDVKITYYLEDEEISPEELAGKSGNVKIRFDYTNKALQTVEVGDKEKEIYVPFTMMSGAMLSNDHFSNIEVTNGRVISSGNTNIVVGMAFPGLASSLDFEDLKEKIDEEDIKEKLDDAQIPEYVEITAYANDFQMDQTMTMAFSDVLSSLNIDKKLDIDTEEFTDSMDELSDGANELADGTVELNDGAGELRDGAQTLAEKSIELDDGAGKLDDGAGELLDGSIALDDGVSKLTDGVVKVDDGVSTLKDGAYSLKDGAEALYDGAKKLDDGADTLYKGAGKLDDGAEALAAGTALLVSQAPALDNGAKQLSEGATSLTANLTAVSLKVDQLYAGMDQVYSALYDHSWMIDAAAAAHGAIPENGSMSENDEVAEELRDISAQLNEQQSEYANQVNAYEAIISEYESKLAQDKEYIDELIYNPQIESVEVVSGCEEAEGEYSYTSGTTKNVYYEYVSDDDEDEELDEDEETENSDEQKSGGSKKSGGYELVDSETIDGEEQTGTYSYTQYYTEYRDIPVYDAEAISSAIDAYKSDSEAYAEAYANYIAYKQTSDELKECAEELGGFVEELGGAPAVAVQPTLMTICQGLYALSSSSDPTQDNQYIMKKLAAGGKTLSDNLDTLAAGTGQALAGAKELNAGAKQLAGGTKELKNGIKTLKDGTSQLKTGSNTLYDGTETLANGTETLKDGTSQLVNGAGELKDGSSRLLDGVVTLKDGTAELKDGTVQFVDGTGELYDGTLTLTDGTKELMDGMLKFKEEGVDKLTELFGDDVQDVIDTLNAVMDAGSNYKIFSESNSDSSVKFIFKTDAIKL